MSPASIRAAIASARRELTVLGSVVASFDAEAERIGTPLGRDKASIEQSWTKLLLEKWARDLRRAARIANAGLEDVGDDGFVRDPSVWNRRFWSDIGFAIRELHALWRWLRNEGRPATAKQLSPVAQSLIDLRESVLADLDAAKANEAPAVQEWRRTHPAPGQIWQQDSQQNFQRQRDILEGRW